MFARPIVDHPASRERRDVSSTVLAPKSSARLNAAAVSA